MPPTPPTTPPMIAFTLVEVGTAGAPIEDEDGLASAPVTAADVSELSTTVVSRIQLIHAEMCYLCVSLDLPSN